MPSRPSAGDKAPGEAKSHRGKKKKAKKRTVVLSAFLVPDTTLLCISKVAWQNLVNMATEKYMQDVEQASEVCFSPSPL